MKLNREQMLARSRARDPRYDGVFITGVLSTGIYCLPSCPARNPNEENIRFFETEQGAREAGLRACKRCRPDLFYRQINPDESLAADLASLVHDSPAKFGDTRALAKASGVGITKLNKLFRTHYHTTPASWMQRSRASQAFRLLLEGESVSETAYRTGHGSLSTFHDNLRKWTAMSPGEIRNLMTKGQFEMRYPKGFRLDLLLRQHSWDGIGPDQKREDREVLRALSLSDGPVTLHFQLGEEGVQVKVAHPKPLTLHQAIELHDALLSLLGLRCDPNPFERRLAGQSEHAQLVDGRTGLRITGTASFFEGIVWVIFGQAVSLAVAHTLRSRLVERVGLPAPEGLLAHPTPQDVAELDVDSLMALGSSRAKAETLLRIATSIATGELVPEALPLEPAGKIERTLNNIRGLGPWSVNYLMMRSLGLMDCVPVGDSGLGAALQRYYALEKRPGKTETLELMAPFAPFRSLATFHLWMSLGD